ncbi:phosphate/phosphite/phosphonate ABC transporter substrate-binding protein [Paenibacillus sp. N3.4]|uniref:phosphate/phosphite/phosphonate ABC transporter substrate-binding protein n=1 Tax=Paenibacillus sp. N3.4 TaxID=2603222 RepID=UPI0011C9CE9D|nr:phosphate/phosphite/phosphonate ABC transporter substrate-binding protein [Paenibacillus sp. N3.4]TXK83527.1 phosphate/phosphite/phosphonate ABC transporter substrate-binding protein [Paenibacillus sp. N3.4]
MIFKKVVLSFTAILISMFFCLNEAMVMASNDDKASILIDNQTLNFEVPPVNNKGTIMVPMRAVFEELHANVTWHEEDQKVTAEKEGISIVLILGSPFAYINDRAVVLSSSPYVSKENAMVPVRFISEAFGAKVTWNQMNQRVTITTKQDSVETLPQNNTASSATFVPNALSIQFVPFQNSEILEAKSKPLQKMLGDLLGIPVKISVSTDYRDVVKAMTDRKVDLSFLPPAQYVTAHDSLKGVDLLMQGLRYGVDASTGRPTQRLVDFYQAMFVVRADSPIQNIEDLRGKTIGWQGVTSAAGYVLPGLVLKKIGINPAEDVKGIHFQGHDKAIQGLLNNQVEAAAVFQDIRTMMLKDHPHVLTDTRILAFTDKIPNDTISVRSDMDPEWRKKIQSAFITIGNDTDGKKLIHDVFGYECYTISDDRKFDIVREVYRLMYD